VRRYGRPATVELAAVTCLWYHVHRARPVQVVLVREATRAGGSDLVSTDLAATPAELLCRYAARWGIEVTFSESKHLWGVGQARNRRRRRRHPPRARALVRHKHTPSTLDMLVAFRRAMLAEYHRTHPAQSTGTELTDALLSWDVTAA
jgi:hypothetical protein